MDLPEIPEPEATPRRRSPTLGKVGLAFSLLAPAALAYLIAFQPG